MFNFDPMIRRAVSGLPKASAVVAFPYDMPRRICELLFEEGVIAGAISDSREHARGAVGSAGWWQDDAKTSIRAQNRIRGVLTIIGVEPSFRVSPVFLFRNFLECGVKAIAAADYTGEIVDNLALENLIESLGRESPSPRVAIDFNDPIERAYKTLRSIIATESADISPRRVLFIIGSVRAGGAERQASLLACALANRGMDVNVACLGLSPPLDFFRPMLEAAGVKVFELGPVDKSRAPDLFRFAEKSRTDLKSSGLGSAFHEVAQCAQLIANLKPSVVHLWMDHYNAIGGFAAIASGAERIILSGRSYAPNQFVFFQPWMRPMYRRVLVDPRVRLLNNSEGGARDYEKWLGIPDGAAKVIRNGFEPPPPRDSGVRARVRASLGFKSDDLFAGGVLRFSEEKRPDFLVEAAIEACKREPRARFAFFGDGPMRQQLISRVETAGLSSAILIPGESKSAMEAISAMDLFLLASRIEGLPNVLVEAQLMGVPVLCTGVGGMTETFVEGVTGVVAPGDDATKFADAALSLLRDPERLARMSLAAIEFARANFSIDKMVEATIEAYEK